MPGFHLPYLAGAANGLFAEHGLDVDILDPAAGPDNVRRVARGDADVCLTSVLHYLVARAGDEALLARFIAVLGQRSPMAGLVAASSPLRTPADLGGARVGAPPDGRLLAEFRACLATVGVDEPVVVPCDYVDAPAALGRGDIDVVPDFADLLPRVRREAGVDVRVVRVGPAVYANGLVAGDQVPQWVAARVRDAVVAANEQQRQAPETGLDALRRRYPEADPEEALEGWKMAVPVIFAGVPVGAMDPARWQATVDHYAAGHGLTAPDPHAVYRATFAVGADSDPATRDAFGGRQRRTALLDESEQSNVANTLRTVERQR